MKSGHRNERGRKEMDLSSKQALAEKAKKLMDPRSANCPKDHTKNKRGGWKMVCKLPKRHHTKSKRAWWKMA